MGGIRRGWWTGGDRLVRSAPRIPGGPDAHTGLDLWSWRRSVVSGLLRHRNDILKDCDRRGPDAIETTARLRQSSELSRCADYVGMIRPDIQEGADR